MSLPKNLAIYRKRGDTKPFRFTIKDDNGVDQPLSGYSFLLSVNAEKYPADTSQQAFSITATNDADGNFSFAPSVSNVNIVGTYYYDVQMTTQAGLIYTLYEGKMKFTQDITK